MLTPAIQRIYQSTGRRVAVRRKELGMTQDDLGAKIGLSRTSVTNIEVGRQRILLHQVFELADALDMDVADMIGLTTTKPLRDFIELEAVMWPGLANDGSPDAP